MNDQEPWPEPVAIVGMSCRFPGGVESPGDYWDLLLSGTDVVSRMPDQRWAEYAADPRNAVVMNRTVRHGAFLDDVAGFDAEFFGVVPREAELMDPQQRLLLEVTWQALEHAGIPATSLAGTDTGVYIGAVSDDYERRLLEDLPGIEAWTGICTQMCGLANRISYSLDLRGASLTVDTACSASLVAVQLACRELAAGVSSLAIVGGVNLIIGPGLTVMLDAAGALSSDGRCKSFDASADGYGRGEGAAVVVLKRLSDAQRDGDHIHAVVRGSAVHQDGRTNGIMAPSEQAQVHLLRSACRAAGVHPGTIDYVEAHGTGTPVGDPIEARALATVLGAGREPGSPCLIGSGKSNIGHLEGAAGVAGIIKAALALRHATIPASINCATPTPLVPWDTSGLQVVTETAPWPVTDHPRRAGVSGYGYGGTLAHVILEQAPLPTEKPQRGVPSDSPQRAPRVFPLSGASDAGLRANAARLADWLESPEPPPLNAVGHTLSARRTHLAQRASVVAADQAELVQRLRAVSAGQEPVGTSFGSPLTPPQSQPVFVFSGHGSQWVGMGRELLAAEPVFAQVLDEIAEVFRAEIGFTPRQILTEFDVLEAVDVIQPAIFAVQVGLVAAWRRYGVEPAAVIGHSVGEIAAAVTAGALSLVDGARLVCRRSQLLRRIAGMGAMVMVNLPFDEAAERLAGRNDVVPAISAAPRWSVLSGEPDAVGKVAEAWQGDGIAVRQVSSDVAFHSPQMEPLVADMALAAESVAHTDPVLPFYRTAGNDPRARVDRPAQYWAVQLQVPVRFAEAVSAAIQDGHRAFLEISSHPIVTHSIWDILAEGGVSDGFATGTLRRGTPDHDTLLANLGALHCHGVHVDFSVMFPDGELADLPTTAWQHRRFWHEGPRAGTSQALQHDLDSHALLGGLTAVTGTSLLRLWQTYLDYDCRPYPGNHPVHGVEIVPAAVLLNTFHAAVANEGTSSLTDMVLRVPISLAAPRELRVTHQDNVLRLASRLTDGAVDEESWLTHTTAEAGQGAPVPALDIKMLRDRITERLPDDHVFSLLATLEVPAMGFPWRVEELWRAADAELLAVVSCGMPQPTTWASVLDAALSLPTAVFPGPPTLRMPAEVGRMTVSGDPEDTVVIHVRLESPDVPDTVTVTVADPAGRVLIELTGLRFGVPDGALLDDEPAAHDGADMAWSQLDADQLRAYLVAEVSRQVSHEIKLPTEDINTRKPLAEMGLDSVMTLGIRRRLEKLLSVRLPASLLWNHPTVEALSHYLAEELSTDRGAAEPAGLLVSSGAA
ncbi:type I polyketide synthase [Streptomyces sp. NBC_00582]|uniref:type I polyketide synthase n=1 Tax=Streptomyces sp. NBC_00582 TaxID=2975783 RepID=UPI002E81533C|nr:beta-ketoacyl synthase N-terminal-like domain-containing protein [Streptomyces sp. NBC_00582]WUB59387.1 acyltransferase domain-containing protein [Streptomyces sp. NBC_00582]